MTADQAAERQAARECLQQELTEALRMCFAFIDDAFIEDGQWDWLEGPRAVLAKASGKQQ